MAIKNAISSTSMLCIDACMIIISINKDNKVMKVHESYILYLISITIHIVYLILLFMYIYHSDYFFEFHCSKAPVEGEAI